MKSKLLFVLILILTIGCTKETILPKKDFIIVNSTASYWAGGRKESGRGVLYTIKILNTSNVTFNKLEVDSLYNIQARLIGDTTYISVVTTYNLIITEGLLYYDNKIKDIVFDIKPKIYYP